MDTRFAEFAECIIEHNHTPANKYLKERILFQTPNGLLFSAIRGHITRGGPHLWELALVNAVKYPNGEFGIFVVGPRDYDSNPNMHGWLSDEDVVEVLRSYKGIVPEVPR